ncbi:MAG: hypothetical protein H0U46_04890 [Actinobacteria bacterium]|nr:hypothetical protein [Actinomycetota bacterium]
MAQTKVRAIAEIGSSETPVYNRASHRRIERRLKREAKRARRNFWRFPSA